MENPDSLEQGVPAARLQCGCSSGGANCEIHSSPQVRLRRDKGSVGSGGNIYNTSFALGKGGRPLWLDLSEVASSSGTFSFAHIFEVGRNHYIIA